MTRIKSKDELYRLRKGCSSWKPENVEPAIGRSFVIRSPFSGSEYHGKIEEYTSWNILEEFIKDGNVYVDR